MQRIEQISQHNHACQPTDGSALSLRADAMSKNASAANRLFYWADAAFAVSVFVFLILLVYKSSVVGFIYSFLFMFACRMFRLYIIGNGYSGAAYSFFGLYRLIRRDRPPTIFQRFRLR